MGRSPCCSKVGLNRGVWTSAEDKILTDYILLHSEGRWRSLPKKAGLKRCGKSCRLRWLNYLRPDIKRGNISGDEEDLIIRLHKLLGNRWSLIAGRLPGRTDNEIKNYWNTSLKKKAHASHKIVSPPPPKIPTKQNNMKKKDKTKRLSTQDNVDSKLADQTTSAQNIPGMLINSEAGSEEGKMSQNVTHGESRETVFVNTNEPWNSQHEADMDTSDIWLTRILSPGFSDLIGSDFYNNEENEIRSTSPSSSNSKSMVEMLEEFWNVENFISEPNLISSDLHFASTFDCIQDWLI